MKTYMPLDGLRWSRDSGSPTVISLKMSFSDGLGGVEGGSLRERRKGEDRAKTGRSQPLTHSKGLAVISEKMVIADR